MLDMTRKHAHELRRRGQSITKRPVHAYGKPRFSQRAAPANKQPGERKAGRAVQTAANVRPAGRAPMWPQRL
jgi:hypothetical protein